MIVHGDTRGAEAMLKAAMDLEKRYHAAMKPTSFTTISRDAIASSASHLWVATIQGGTDEAVCGAPDLANSSARSQGTPTEPSQDFSDTLVANFAGFSPIQGAAAGPVPFKGLPEDPKPARVSDERRHRSAPRHRFGLEWAFKLCTDLRTVVETGRQREIARFMIRPSVGSLVGKRGRHHAGLVAPKRA
jgi:hypothetical protein